MQPIADFSSGALPFYAQFVGLLISSLVIWIVLRRAGDWSSKFVIGAIWLRFILSAFPLITYPSIAAGLSINALASMCVVMVGFFSLQWKIIFNVIGLAIFPYLLATVVSATLNGLFMANVDTILKLLYFFVIAAHIFVIFKNGREVSFSRTALFAFCPLVIFQAISIAMRIYKKTEADGSVSYIGGYNHEAIFSSALFGLIILSVLGESVPRRLRWFALSAGVIGIFLANYRTAILAAGPVLLYFLISQMMDYFPRHLRPIALMASGLLVITAMSALMTSTDRLEDLPNSISLLSDGIPRPEEMTRSDRRVLSGRLYLWSMYIDDWRRGDTLHHIIGFGPDSYKAHYKVYAHNTFVHCLYEYGWLGLITMVFLFILGFVLAALGHPEARLKVLAAHLSFLTLNMSTMPMWQIEGLIAIAIIWGWTAANFARAGRRTAPNSRTNHT